MGLFPIFSLCCFCLNLRTASLLFGILSLVTSVALFAQTTVLIFITANNWKTNRLWTEESIAPFAFFVTISSIDLVFIVTNFVMAILLIIGILKRKPCLLRTFVIFKTIMLLYSLFVHCIKIYYGYSKLNPIKIYLEVFGAYCTLCVHNYYEQIVKGNECKCTEQPLPQRCNHSHNSTMIQQPSIPSCLQLCNITLTPEYGGFENGEYTTMNGYPGNKNNNNNNNNLSIF